MSPLLLLIVLILALLAVRWYLQTSAKVRAAAWRSLLTWFVLGLLVFLAATGKLGIIVPILGALVAALLRLAPVLVQFLPVFHRIWQQRRSRQAGDAGDPNRSTARTEYLRMDLNHATGEISGRVLSGRFAGRDLHSMSLQELLELHRECRSGDADSAALLEAYLDRVHGARWRTEDRSARSRSPARSEITAEEAYQILGLEPGASRDAIIQAHRRLMQKLHPDRGGSDYLAAEINRAKEILLGS